MIHQGDTESPQPVAEAERLKSLEVPRLVVASCLRELGGSLYDAYVDQSWQDRYNDIAEAIIDKLSQSGISLVMSEVRVELPTNQKRIETTSTGQQ